MYLTSFVHREDLFKITERWLCGRLEPEDGARISEILVCDGFVLGEILDEVVRQLLGMAFEGPIRTQQIHFKGELRDAIARSGQCLTARCQTLIQLYKDNPDFFYREAPINGVVCVDAGGQLIGLHRIKRPRRIAEKANRYIANWIFRMVQERARNMATARASDLGISIEHLLTPKEEMTREFIQAEEVIAQGFREGIVHLDRAALTIHDVGGIKIVAEEDRLTMLEKALAEHPTIRIVERERYRGDYRADSLILEIPWDQEMVCRRYLETEGWARYLNRGIPGKVLRRGLEPLLVGALTTVQIELILCTFPDMVESELGSSIHEERIIAQRDNKVYKGYIPMNLEFLIEYLFAVGFCPKPQVDHLPIKLWGRYLPDTVISHIRQLYDVPEYEIFH